MIRRLLSQESTATSTKFRWRSYGSSRLEELSDVVIGFALTLLVVSLEVPRTFDDLLATIRGFAAFGICFVILIAIWYEHYTFFRRYGLQDTRVIVLNTVLLFVIVFYVYPLKFLFTLTLNSMFGMGVLVSLPGGGMAPMIREEQVSQVYIIYGMGWIAVWLVFTLLYRHALQQGERLELNPLEILDTRTSIVESLVAVGAGLISMGLVIFGAADLAGWVYVVMIPAMWAIERRNALRRRTLETRLMLPNSGKDSTAS